MSFLELAHLKKTYPDGTEAVKRLDLSIEAGVFMVLLGPSGCGKTTTLRMVAGLETPTSGQIHLDGKEVTHLPPSRRDVGFVFQFYALYPHLTVWQNIAFPLENIGTPRTDIDPIVSAMASRLGISHLLNRSPRHLSGGDQQRVSLARAMVRKPAVYLLDEPLGTLDAEHRLELREFIRTQQLELSVTALYVTHDQEEAMSLADRIVIMDQGEIRQVGPPSDVYDRPEDLFVATFVGSPGMNLVPGRVETVSEGCRFVSQNGRAAVPLGSQVRPGPVVLGIRPEFIRPDRTGIPGRVTLNEYLGNHRMLHLETSLGPLVMRALQNSAFGNRETLTVQFDSERTRLFDPETGKRLE